MSAISLEQSQLFYKLLQGDCLEILPTLKPKSVDVIIADLPYNVKIASWDNITNYDGWLLECFKQFERVLKPNGTLWFFHMSFPVVSRLNVALEQETAFRFKQFITINKGLQSIAGRTSDALRSYPRATEYLLFYTFEDSTGIEQLSSAQINPMANYLKAAIEKANVTCKDVAEACHFYGKVNHGGMVSNWLKGLSIPSKEQFEQMITFLNRKAKLSTGNYAELQKELELKKADYESLRYTFNMASGVTDVWDYSFYEINDSSHPTVKPLKLIKRIIETATKKGDVVLDPTAGSGSTLRACKDLERSCIAIDKSSKYVSKIQASIINQSDLRQFNFASLHAQESK